MVNNLLDLVQFLWVIWSLPEEAATFSRAASEYTYNIITHADWTRNVLSIALWHARTSRKHGCACKGEHTLFTGQKKRERERGRIFMLARLRTPFSAVRERERERERDKERGRGRERDLQYGYFYF
jgi:hypothetical protein